MYALLLAQNPDEKAVLSLVLQRAGLAVIPVVALERALQMWPERPADLILAAFHNDNALDGSRAIRAETSVPLVVIVDAVDENLHWELLEVGADLVVFRPFSARLLMSQVRSLLRRAGGMPLSSLPTLSLSGLRLDPVTRTVQVTGQPSHRLTHLEFRLMYTLMMNRGQVLYTETIVEQVWGYSGRGDKDLLRGLVRRLRTKVEPNPRQPRYIITVPGIGYSFDPEEK